MFVHYNLYIFIILIYSRVMRMRIRTSFIHTFTQTFTQSCIRACASLSQLFEFNIKMDSPVLSHILKLFSFSSSYRFLSSFLPFIPTYLPSSSFLRSIDAQCNPGLRRFNVILYTQQRWNQLNWTLYHFSIIMIENPAVIKFKYEVVFYRRDGWFTVALKLEKLGI